ncbi:SRPBCC domain-containing protein [Comamonas terrigena]|uniref:SRPBCC domain-containing protein n=1 Tax=Comamonas terrigena TaxID=32013 RepID=UPI00244A38CE|nr:SRPBCC domain-containing protein [Comamonas terrigena]MDH1700424.1 polyketide cyclase [Comamonas terrigena]
MTRFQTHRHFAAPPDAVFAALADPARLARWWGPDGRHYANESVFETVDAPDRVVIRHLNHPHFRLTITLTDHPSGGQPGTRVDWEQVFDSADVAAAVQAVVVPANEQNLDRWQAEVAAQKPTGRD